MTFEDWMEGAVHSFEAAGVAVMIVGSLVVLGRALVAIARGNRSTIYEPARQGIGRAILMGLEILIIADIIQTVTLDPTVESALFLGTIVLVRTFLSFSLDIELTGRVPWREAEAIEQATAPGVSGIDTAAA
jgi:uncharacterized membrane protein